MSLLNLDQHFAQGFIFSIAALLFAFNKSRMYMNNVSLKIANLASLLNWFRNMLSHNGIKVASGSWSWLRPPKCKIKSGSTSPVWRPLPTGAAVQLPPIVGVKDMWTILAQVKREKSLTDLIGKWLAVDLSGWVCQADTSYQGINVVLQVPPFNIRAKATSWQYYCDQVLRVGFHAGWDRFYKGFLPAPHINKFYPTSDHAY